MGSSNETSHFEMLKIHRYKLCAGGSSGGSAACVAAGCIALRVLIQEDL